MSEPITNTEDAVRELGALPVPMGSVVEAADPRKHLLGYGWRDTETGMLHSHIRWPNGNPPTPFGCRWCGTERGHHGRRWMPGHGVHGWVQPTQAQIKARMLARRDARKAVCRCVPPEEQQPLAPVIDPWKCEAEHCRMHDRLVSMWLTPMFPTEAVALLGGERSC